jgi:Mg-chelatase subunit ChlD
VSGGLALSAPWWLLLLPLAVAFVLWAERNTRVRLGTGRARVARSLRLLALGSLVLALAGLTAWRVEDRLTVIFAADVSKSVGVGGRETAAAGLGELSGKLPERDRAGVIVFGEASMVESHPAEAWQPGPLLATPEDNGTDLESAVRLARGLFPPGQEARLVLLTDGIETEGSIEEAVTDLGDEVDVVWVPLAAAGTADVLVEQIAAPDRILEDQPHRLRVVVRSSSDTEAVLRIWRGGTLISAAPVQLAAGRPNVFTVEQTTPTASGALLYRAEVEAANDPVAENNRASAVVRVEGRPRVLLAGSDPAALQPLTRVLQNAGMRVDTGAPASVPHEPVGLAAYDALVLADVPATTFSEPHLGALEAYVVATGGGLVMLGGPRSFGLGGYWDTPVEAALPVDMEVKDRTHHPSIGLVLCIDKSGSMGGMGTASKIDVAKAAAAAVAEQLTPMDRVGVIAFDAASKWVVPMMSGGDKAEVQRKLGTLRAGGGTDAYPAMQDARTALKGEDVRVKHVVLLTDGQLSARNHEGLARVMESEGVTLSTVGVGGDADLYTLERIARFGGGLFYRADDADRLPRIFMREAFRISRSWLVEETFRPEVRGDHPALRGLDLGSMPPLEGYVAASEKPGAQHPLGTHRGDPLLSLWRYGLGKSVAFTSDAEGRWSSAWLRWSGYAPFWSSVMRWVARDRESSERLQVVADAGDGTLRVGADLFAPDGSFVNGAPLRAVVMGPGGERQEVPLEQVGPGRYEVQVPATRPGPYMAAVLEASDGAAGGAGGYATTVVPYPGEFRGLNRAPEALERLVESGRARRSAIDPDLFVHRGNAGKVRWSLAPWLLGLGGLLMVAEVGVRKLRVGAEVWAFLRRRRVVEASERLGRLRGAQVRARRRFEPAKDAAPAVAREPVRETAAAPAVSTAPPEPVAPADPGGRSTSRLLAAKRRRRKKT